jgi:S-(hydroxymethyl)glutathione dehydrogenase/alcohol dehydrogenase
MEAAFNILPDLTMGKNADVVIITVGVLTGDLIEQARSILAKGGVIVTTSIAPYHQNTVDLNLFAFAMFNQEIRGTVFGSESPRVQIPRLLRLYHEGKLHIDDLITREYSVEEVQKGYDELESGLNVRGVVRF